VKNTYLSFENRVANTTCIIYMLSAFQPFLSQYTVRQYFNNLVTLQTPHLRSHY